MLFLSCVYWAFQLMILALYTFPADRVVVTKERAAGLYSISAYFLARTSVDTLTTVLMSPLLITNLLLRRGPATVGRRLAFAHAISELACAHSAGLCIGAWIMNLKRATTLQTVFMLATMMCGGFYVRGVPTWLKWFGDLSFTRYAYGALLKVEYKGAHYDCASGRCAVLRESALVDARIRRSSVGADLAVLAGFAVAFRLLAFFGLKRNTRRASRRARRRRRANVPTLTDGGLLLGCAYYLLSSVSSGRRWTPFARAGRAGPGRARRAPPKAACGRQSETPLPPRRNWDQLDDAAPGRAGLRARGSRRLDGSVLRSCSAKSA